MRRYRVKQAFPVDEQFDGRKTFRLDRKVGWWWAFVQFFYAASMNEAVAKVREGLNAMESTREFEV